jgi:RNA 2',3'-cyclic 3'-phosphodiesterase
MRPVPALRSHVTLAFLGEKYESHIGQIVEALDRAATPVTGLSLGAPVWLPPRRPRVLALEIHDAHGELATCQDRVAAALEEAIGWLSDRSFRAHLTAIRLGRGFRPDGLALPVSPALDFAAEAVTLYASRLLPEGAQYDPLATVDLREPEP